MSDPGSCSQLAEQRDDERVPILIVDDRHEDLQALTAVLATSAVEIVTARSGAGALRAVLERDFAVILLDVRMPDMDGFEVASIIKRRERSKQTPILFLTAAGVDVKFIYRAYSMGAVDFLSKPIDKSVVRAKVDVFAELFRKDLRIQRQAEALREADKRESDQRYRNLAEAIPQIVWTASAQGEVNYYNRRFTDYTGVPSTPPPAWLSVVHDDDVARCRVAWREAVSARALYEDHCRLVGRDGEVRWHLVRAVPELDQDGKVVAWLGTHTDSHDLRCALDFTEAARARATFLADAGALLASSLDWKGTLGRLARIPVPRLADWCTVEVRDVSVKRAFAAAHVDPSLEHRLHELRDRADDDDWLPRAPDDRELADEDIEAFTKDKDHARLLRQVGMASVLRVPLVMRDRLCGEMIFGTTHRSLDEGALQIAADLSRYGALAIDNARLLLASGQALLARDEFLSIASHELRTPLTALHLQLQSVLRSVAGPSPAQNGEGTFEKNVSRIESAVRQAERLATLTERLLDVSRIVTGTITLDIEELDLSQLAAELVERFESDAVEAGCRVQLFVDGPVRGRWDRTRVEQVLTNLLSNALKYGRGQAVEILVKSVRKRALFSVRDHGIGIASADLERIFDRFERAAPSKIYQGLGIGLYVSKQIAEAHGGSIRVESEPGRGSTFTLSLPVVAHVETSAPNETAPAGG